ncbi:MAG TPA: SGNH/GDSL hydrolase family protein [Xenococcaceae cyanobacterium]
MSSSLSFDRLVFFGDSLTDTGGTFELSSQNLVVPLPPESLGYAQRFSNGEVYADIAPRLLGIEAVENFAFTAAASLGELSLGTILALNGVLGLQSPDADLTLLDFDVNLNAQVDRFLNDPGNTDHTAASLFIGLNDFGQFVLANPEATASEADAFASNVANSTLAAADRLVDAGVETIILNTLPASSFFPLSTVQPPLPDEVIDIHNEELLAGSAELTASGANVFVVDFAAIAEEIAADPSAFGFLAPLSTFKFFGVGGNPTITETPDGPVLSFPENPASLPNLDQQAFFDLVHPTTATHGIFAAFYSESLTSDVQILDSDNDIIKGSRIDDLVLAGGGNDRVLLRGGDDVALGGLGNDIVLAGSGDDIISLGSGHDLGFGGQGDDIIAGGVGNDLLLGDRGNDVLIDGLGSDKVFGGSGDDLFISSESTIIGGTGTSDRDLFFGGHGHDTLFLVLTNATRKTIEGANDIKAALTNLGISTNSIENIQFIESPAELSTLEVDARIVEADLWGLI